MDKGGGEERIKVSLGTFSYLLSFGTSQAGELVQGLITANWRFFLPVLSLLRGGEECKVEFGLRM